MSGFTQIGVGSSANDGTGDALRTAMQAVNGNYTSTVRAIASTSSLATETAAAGFVRVLYNDLGEQTFAADNSGLTVDNIKVFASATVGWTWVRTMPAWVDITAPRFRCIGNDSFDCTSNLQAAADYAFANGLPIRIPAGTYKVTDFINFYDLIVLGNGRDRSIIKSYANNKPVAVFSGSNFFVEGIGYHFDSTKTNRSCSNILIAGVSNGSTGAHWSSFRDVGLINGNYGIHTVGSLSTTLTSGAASGATSISVNSVSSGIFDCIVSGGWITVSLNSGSQNVQVDYVSGTTVHLKEALTGEANSGNSVSVYETVFFSNTLDNIYIRYWNDYAILHNGSGTGCKFDNIYMNRSESNAYLPCKGYMYLASFNDGSFGQINLEWAEISGNAISSYGGDTLAIDSLHCEGVKFGSANRAYISTTMPSLNVTAWTIDDWVVPSASTSTALIRAESVTSSYIIVQINNLTIRESKIESPNNVFFLNNLAANRCYVYIDGYSPKINSGIDTRGALVTPSSACNGLKKLSPLFDIDTIAYGFQTVLVGVQDISIYANCNKAAVESVYLTNCEHSLTTATAEVNTEAAGAGTAVIPSNALSAITGPEKYFTAANDSGIDNSILDFSSDGRLYFRVTAAQSAVSVSGTSSSVARGVDGINTITWGSSHGVKVGEIILISGATNTTFNGTFSVLEVTSTTIKFYKYTGLSVDITADTGISISRYPVIDVYLKGQAFDKLAY